VTFTPGSFKAGFLGRLDDKPGMTTGVWQLRPDSRGRVHIRSASPEDKPLIQPNFLSDERDQVTVVEGLKLARRIMATPDIARYCVAETMPGPDTRSDAELLDYSRRQGLCGYHVSGTCRMGPASDPGAVVDSELKVRGVERLRVADPSIMPTIVSGNTNAAAMMIGAKAADLLARARN
jgi:choline dehydrogenase